jgi:crotonobetainyl-CoA:carnitine CoA-transferase CaiB-like acyl-CoA transferase
MSRRLPLEGVRVVDVTVVWAGPHCTQLLAEWGAEVIRVEPLQHIQSSTRGAEVRITKEQVARTRQLGGLYYGFPGFDPGERPWNRNPAFNSHARNKRSMTLDVNFPEGRDAFLKLIAASDVVVENNVPETVGRVNLTYDQLAAVNPALIMLRMPAYGLDGPYENYRSFGTHMEAMTGHHHLRSYTNLDPSMTGDAFTADAAGGVMGAVAVVMALRYRRRTGKGQQIELAQAENFLPYLAEALMDYSMNGRETPPQGNHHSSHAPHNVYPCAGPDRWITIDVGDDAGWRGLCDVLGRPAWSCDQRFADPLSRWHHREELDGLLAKETRDRDLFELWHALIEAGVTAGPVQNERDAFSCPQLRARGFFEPLTSPDTGTFEYPGLTFKLANTPNHLRRHPVMLGEDNDYVYHELLDLPEEEFSRLVENGHIGTSYPGR